MSTIRIVTIILLSLILFAIFSYFLLTYVFYAITLKRNGLLGKYIQKVFHDNLSKYGINLSWWNSQKLEKLKIKNGDIKLSGIYIKNENAKSNKLAIILHGYFSSYKDMEVQAKIFYDLGFNIFCPDQRGHGDSEGKTISMGYFEKDDLKKWIEFLINKYGKDTEIAIFGWSMGAAVANYYACFQTSKNVKCIISDCSYSNAYSEFKAMLKQYKMPVQPTMFFVNQGAKMYGEFFLKDVDIENAIKFNEVPTLFIHGEKDSLVPVDMSEKLFNLKTKGHNQLEIFDGAEHCMSYASDKERYVQLITEFINIYFK